MACTEIEGPARDEFTTCDESAGIKPFKARSCSGILMESSSWSVDGAFTASRMPLVPRNCASITVNSSSVLLPSMSVVDCPNQSSCVDFKYRVHLAEQSKVTGAERTTTLRTSRFLWRRRCIVQGRIRGDLSVQTFSFPVLNKPTNRYADKLQSIRRVSRVSRSPLFAHERSFTGLLKSLDVRRLCLRHRWTREPDLLALRLPHRKTMGTLRQSPLNQPRSLSKILPPSASRPLRRTAR